jgi:hypothetical protein
MQSLLLSRGLTVPQLYMSCELHLMAIRVRAGLRYSRVVKRKGLLQLTLRLSR